MRSSSLLLLLVYLPLVCCCRLSSFGGDIGCGLLSPDPVPSGSSIPACSTPPYPLGELRIRHHSQQTIVNGVTILHDVSPPTVRIQSLPTCQNRPNAWSTHRTAILPRAVRHRTPAASHESAITSTAKIQVSLLCILTILHDHMFIRPIDEPIIESDVGIMPL